MKRSFLPLIAALLLASAQATTAAAVTASSTLDCDTPRPVSDLAALPRATQALDAAQAAPGPHNLLLASALADMALVRARLAASSARKGPAGPQPLDYLERAQTIWQAAPADAALTEALLQRGRAMRSENHCALALGVLETALAVADKTKGDNAQLAGVAVRELVQVAAAIGDDPTMHTVAPRLLAALATDPAPLKEPSYPAYLALADYYYKTEDNERAELVLNSLIERARTAVPSDQGVRRRLQTELASVYYAQSRYAEAEQLVARAAPTAGRDLITVDSLRVEGEMTAKVRAGQLKAALTLGEAALARYGALLGMAEAALNTARTEREGASKAARHGEAEAARQNMIKAGQERAAYRLALVNTQGNVAELHHGLGEYEEALALYEQCIGDDPGGSALRLYKTSRMRAGMALIYRARGDTARALALQQQVRAELLPLLGARHPDVLEAETQIAALTAPDSGRIGKPAPAHR